MMAYGSDLPLPASHILKVSQINLLVDNSVKFLQTLTVTLSLFIIYISFLFKYIGSIQVDQIIATLLYIIDS